METPLEVRDWLVDRIKALTDWSKPMTHADIPEGADVSEVDEEPPGPELNIYEDAAEIVREAGEHVLLLGLHDLYQATRIRSAVTAQWPAPEPTVCEAAITGVAGDSTETMQEQASSVIENVQEPASDATEIMQAAAGDIARPLVLPDVTQPTSIRSTEIALPMLAIEDAKSLLGQCLAAVNELIEKGGHAAPATVPPALMLSQEEAAASALPIKRTKDENQMLALGLLHNHPDWSLQRIAKVVGVERRTLYNWKGFQTAWRAAKAKDTRAIPRGFKSSDGTIEAYPEIKRGNSEAYDPPDTCVSCGDVGVHDFKGKNYCRGCYLKKVQEDQDAEDARRGGRPSPLGSRIPMRKPV